MTSDSAISSSGVSTIKPSKTPLSSSNANSTSNLYTDKITTTNNNDNKTKNSNKKAHSLQTTKALSRITSHPTLTPFRRRVYRTLLSVPASRWTTYSALSRHLSSSPRAIGNAMKTNPFAPQVPCHRVLATDRTLGGYKGAWNNGGEYSVEKMKLLLEEGVEFDGDGKARGVCFVDFVELSNK